MRGDRDRTAIEASGDGAGYRYSVFGGVLRSDLPMAGLPRTAGPASWTLRVGESYGRRPAEHDILTGRQELTPSLALLSYRRPDGGIRLRYDGLGVGEFVISADGSDILWLPGAEPPLAHLRYIVLGRVMAMAMYLAGTLCLHGSGVELDGRVVCFVGPKFHGKSTLAARLVAAGGRLASDDSLALDPGPPVRVRPGVPALRLAEPDHVGVPATRRHRPVGGGKTTIEGLPKSRVMRQARPAAGIYLLDPVLEEPEAGAAAAIQPLGPVAAFRTLVAHSIVAPLLDPGQSAVLVDHAAAASRAVPVYRLRVLRDKDRLDEVVERCIESVRASGRTGVPHPSVGGV